ncbi:calcium/proton exchanger [Lichenihabitans sp. Uapishka_5]|uniref:calcium/proton exchanger n=1 Tax=Lichenihabitans sp. Uapishka_5 TaxID=3037302 RepID=UPI0029E7D085|nr:calcium/proton exchanger [Lichenihabitans sp. Uapishka_5]MDX7950419.1 calcium/proton exchanger [Lichenihabitans sp. Uapishka_5]
MVFIALAFVPLSLLVTYGLHAPALLVFGLSAAALAVLADWTRRATEQLAERAGPALGGLMNVSLGSMAEIILAFFVLRRGQADVVQAQLVGSILGTTLLGLGLAVMAGGIGRDKQVFDRQRVGLLSTLLLLSTVALMLPAVFDLTGRRVTHNSAMALSDEYLSLGAAAILLLLYGGNLLYTLVTHRDVFASDDERGQASWSLGLTLGVLAAATVMVAWEAEIVSDALTEAAGALHFSPTFLGVVVLALIGTGGDLIAAVAFARQDKMSLVLNIAIGSAIQIALVVAPLLVILSWLAGHPMTLVFSNPLQLFSIAAAAFIVRSVAADGETTWFEGLLLVGVYALLALGFFFVEG